MKTTKISVAAGKTVTISEGTFAHRAALKANGWTWARGSSEWTKSFPAGGCLVPRSGCRATDGLTIYYDDTSAKYVHARDAHDDIDQGHGGVTAK